MAKLPTCGKLKMDKASVTVVPGPTGQVQDGVDDEGHPKMVTAAPDAVKYLHVELPKNEPYKLVLESGASKKTLCELTGPTPESGCATIVQIRIRARTNGCALVEPVAEEEVI